MGTEIDRLEIQIEAQASKANRQLDELISKLGRLSGSLSSINSGGMRQFAVGMNEISSAAKNLATIKTGEMNRVVNNLQKLGSIKTGNMYNVGNALLSVTKGIQGFSGISAVNIPATVSSLLSLSKLGNKGIKNASSVMPVLAKNMQDLATTLNAVNVNSDIAAQLSAISSALRSFGHKGMKTAIDNMPALSNGLKNLMKSLSTAPRVSANLINLANALSRLSTTGGSVRTTASAIQSVSQRTGNTTSGLQRLSNSLSSFTLNTKKAEKSTRRLSISLSSLYANCFLLIRGFRILGKAVTSSMDYIETYNYYNVTMSKIASEFSDQWQQYGYESGEAYAASFSSRLNELTRKMSGYTVGSDGVLSITGGQNLSLDPEQIMNYQSNVAAITNSVGLVGETSINTAKALSMLAADMSSLKNIDMSTVMTNFQSGLIGQSRALYKYGIDITNATLQTYAYKYGLETAVSEMTQADKMQLRLLAILDQSKVAWGDQANTLNSVANQYRILKQQIANLARIVGNLLIPIIAKALPVINGVIIALQRMFTFIGNLLGVDWSGLMDGISTGYGGAGDAIGDLIDDTDDVADSAGDISDNLDNAYDSAKKLRKTLLGFDELNVLADNSDASTNGSGSGDSTGNVGDIGGGAGAIDLSGAIADALADYESVWDKALKNSQNKAQEYADSICNAFKRIWDLAEPTREAVSRLWDEGLAKFGNFSADTLYDFWNNFLKPIGTWMLADDAGLPRFFNITNDLLNEIDWERLRTSLADFYTALQTVAQFTWTGLMDFYEAFLKPMSVWVMSSAIPQLVDILTEFIDKVDWESINTSLKNFWTALAPFAQNVGQELINFFKQLMDIGAEFLNMVVPGGLDRLAEALKKISPEEAQRIGEALGKIAIAILLFKGVATVVKGVADFGLALKGLVEGLGFLFGGSGLIAGVLDKLKLLTAGFSGLFAGGGILAEVSVATVAGVVAAIAAVSAVLIDLWKTSETFRDAVGFAFEIVKNSLVSAFNQIKEAVSPLWQKIKDLASAFYDFYESSGIKSIVELIASLAAVLIGIVSSYVIETLGKTISGFATAIGGAIDVLTGFFDILSGFFTLDDERVLEGFGKIGSGIINIFTGLKDGMLSWCSDFIDWMFGVGVDIVNGLLEGIVSIITGIGEWLKQHIVDPIVNGVKRLFGIQSPSTVFAEIGTFLIQGLLGGITDTIGSVLTWFGELPGKIREALGNAKEWLVEKGKGAIEGLKNGWNAVKDSSLGQTVSKIGSYVKGKAGDAVSWLRDKGSDAISGLKNGWESVKDGTFLSKVGNIAGEVFGKIGDIKGKTTGKGKDVVEGLLSGYNARIDGLMNKIKALRNGIYSALGDIAGRVTPKGKEIVSGMKAGLTDNWSSLTSWLSGIPNRISNAIGSLYDTGQSTMQSFVNGMKSVYIPTPSMYISAWDYHDLGDGGSMSTPRFSVQWYADGGFPGTGELFFARESGPEMVGRMGGRSTVANNDQIVDGIAAGVYDAVVAAMRAVGGSGNQSSQPPIIELTIQEDSETTYKRVLKGKEKHDRRFSAVVKR